MFSHSGWPNPRERTNEIRGGAKLCQSASRVLSRHRYWGGASAFLATEIAAPEPSNAGRGRTLVLPIGARRRPIQTDSGLESPRAEERAKSDVCGGRDPPTPTEPAKRPLPRPADSPPHSGAAARERRGIGGSREGKLRGGRRRRNDARPRTLKPGGCARKEVKPGSRELAERRRVAGGLRDTHTRLWEKLRRFLNPEERRKISTEETWVGNLSPVSERGIGALRARGLE